MSSHVIDVSPEKSVFLGFIDTDANQRVEFPTFFCIEGNECILYIFNAYLYMSI